MKNNLTLNNETIEKLRRLVNEINVEESKDDECDVDVVTFNMYEIVEVLNKVLNEPNEPNEPTFPTVVLKLHLYDVDENENPIHMDDDVVTECIADILSSDGVHGYTITDYEVVEETLPH